jgi:hypothetical protein
MAKNKGAVSTMSVEDFIARAMELRTTMFENEAAFFLFLVDGENGGVDWRGAYTSFEELVARVIFGGTAKYCSFRYALKRVPREQASIIGVDGTIKVAAVESSAKRNEIVVSLGEARRRRGAPLSNREVTRVIQQLAPVVTPTRDLLRVMSRDRVEQENRALRKENERLRKEVEKLRKENAKLKGIKQAN